MKSTIFLVLLAFGCGDASPINITKSVGAEGGTVTGSDGTSLNIPMGALTASANITISDDSGASDNVVLTDTLGVATTFGVGITDVSKVQPVRAARSRSASTS